MESRLKIYKMATSILLKFLTLKCNISRTIWRIEVGDGSFLFIFHALSFELIFFRPGVPFKRFESIATEHAILLSGYNDFRRVYSKGFSGYRSGRKHRFHRLRNFQLFDIIKTDPIKINKSILMSSLLPHPGLKMLHHFFP